MAWEGEQQLRDIRVIVFLPLNVCLSTVCHKQQQEYRNKIPSDGLKQLREAAQTVFGGSAGHTPWPTLSSKPLPREDILGILVYLVLSASNPKISFPKLQQVDASEIGFAGTELFPSHMFRAVGSMGEGEGSDARHPLKPFSQLARPVHLLLSPY